MDSLLIPTFFCPKAWEGMAGNEATRFCSYCNKHVHNLDALSVSERFALLTSPAASICSRYKVALRRAKPGKRESYERHLLKYGVGVAVAGSTMLSFWEMYARSHRPPSLITHNRVTAPTEEILPSEMPEDLYEETETHLMGMIVAVPIPPKNLTSTTSCPPAASYPAPYVDLHLEPQQVEQLLRPASPTVPDLNSTNIARMKRHRK